MVCKENAPHELPTCPDIHLNISNPSQSLTLLGKFFTWLTGCVEVTIIFFWFYSEYKTHRFPICPIFPLYPLIFRKKT